MLGHLAENQLAAWEKLAEDWPLTVDGDQRVLRCGDCDKGILVLTDRTGAEYQYTPDEHRALVVLHLRNFHPGLDPDRAD